MGCAVSFDRYFRQQRAEDWARALVILVSSSPNDEDLSEMATEYRPSDLNSEFYCAIVADTCDDDDAFDDVERRLLMRHA